MANRTITNTLITALGTSQVLTWIAANEGGAGVAQKFIYTPTGRDSKLCFVMYNAVAFAITATITAGVGTFGAAAKVNTIPGTAGTYVLQVETGKYLLANGTIEISFVPVNGAKILTADHALTVGVIELQ